MRNRLRERVCTIFFPTRRRRALARAGNPHRQLNCWFDRFDTGRRSFGDHIHAMGREAVLALLPKE